MKNILLATLSFIMSTSASAGLYFNAFGHRDGSKNANNMNIECSFHGWPNDDLVQAEQNRNNEGEILLAPEVAYMSFDVNAGVPKTIWGWFNVRQETFEFTTDVLNADYRSAKQLSTRLIEGGGGYEEGSGRTKFRWSDWNVWETHLSDISYLISNGASKNNPTKNVYLYMEHVFGANNYRKWIDPSVGGGADNLTEAVYPDNSGVQKLNTGGRMFGKWYAKYNRWDGKNAFTWDGGEYTCTLKGTSVFNRSVDNGLLSKSGTSKPGGYFANMTPRIKAWQKDDTVEGTLAQYQDRNGNYVSYLEKDGKFVNSQAGSFGPLGVLFIGMMVFLRYSRNLTLSTGRYTRANDCQIEKARILSHFLEGKIGCVWD